MVPLERLAGYEPKKCPDKKNNLISSVDDNGIAEELGIEPGDRLVSVNSHEVVDLIDYMYLIDDEYVEVEIEKACGDIWILEIEKEPGENLGIEFDNPIIDEAKSCSNRCIFCFIDQLPSGMRETLYFKDDDSRLSFLQGNFVTLTNMSDGDIDRIISYNISPINVSVHTTDPALRRKMLGNKSAGDILQRLEKLTNAGIEVNAQIVLCKGINDGDSLMNTLTELSGMKNPIGSVAIVPFGATKYRDKLYNIELYDACEAGDIIDEMRSFQSKMLDKLGTRFAFLSDEFYLLAERDFPDADDYEGFIQIENGVGLLKKFELELNDYILQNELEKGKLKKRGAMITGTSGYAFMKNVVCTINGYTGYDCVEVFQVVNDFFGNTVNVTGLLTGSDVERQCGHLMKSFDVLFLPESMFKDGEEIMLDDMTLDQLSKALNIKIVKARVDGASIIEVLTDNLK